MARLPAPSRAIPNGTGGVKPESIETPAGLVNYTAETAKDGVTNVRRYSMIFVPGGTFSGYIAVQVPENATKIYTDEAVRQMFASATVRKEVPVDEQLCFDAVQDQRPRRFQDRPLAGARRGHHPPPTTMKRRASKAHLSW